MIGSSSAAKCIADSEGHFTRTTVIETKPDWDQAGAVSVLTAEIGRLPGAQKLTELVGHEGLTISSAHGCLTRNAESSSILRQLVASNHFPPSRVISGRFQPRV